MTGTKCWRKVVVVVIGEEMVEAGQTMEDLVYHNEELDLIF